ncbi:MAG: hypothetical protein HY705_03860 [Gemmatimonadetes bacterium]|nr:hypothetical protein [Gemmatimonadota bacterium]
MTVETVEYRGWKGRENGELLQAAEGEFDVFVTMDDNLPEQQNLQQFDLAVAVLRARSKSLDDLIELIPELERRLSQLDLARPFASILPDNRTHHVRSAAQGCLVAGSLPTARIDRRGRLPPAGSC